MKHEIKKLEMEMAWQSSQFTGSLVDEVNEVTVTLVTASGTRVPLAVGFDFQSNYAYDAPHFKLGESVEDAWQRLGRPEIARVEVTEKGHDSTSGRDYEEWDKIVWYVPEGRTELAKLELIEWAAKALLAKDIGFSEFKRIMRENP
jgi:hypothetical protein